MSPLQRAAAVAVAISTALFSISVPGSAATAPAAAAQGEDVRICTSTIELDPGRAGPEPARPPVRIRVRYRAVSLSAGTLETMRTHPRAQAFFNARVLRRLVQLSTDVPLQIGAERLAPGTHDAGFRSESDGRWRFLVLDRQGRPRIEVPLAVTTAEAEIPCLNLALVPGTDRAHIVLAARYGTLRGTVTLAVASGAKTP